MPAGDVGGDSAPEDEKEKKKTRNQKQIRDGGNLGGGWEDRLFVLGFPGGNKEKLIPPFLKNLQFTYNYNYY